MSMLSIGMAAVLAADPTITHNFGAKPLTQIVGELARLTGQPLGASSRLQQDILYVNLKETPLGEVKEILARHSGGKWVTRDGGEVLEAPSSRLTLEEIGYRRTLDEWFEGLKQPAPLGEREIQQNLTRIADQAGGGRGVSFQQGMAMSPSQRLFSSLLRAIGKTELLKLAPGERRVYSTRPAGIQYPFPPTADPALLRFRQEATAFTAAIRSGGHKPDDFAGTLPGSRGLHQGISPQSIIELSFYRGDLEPTAQIRVWEAGTDRFVLADSVSLPTGASEDRDLEAVFKQHGPLPFAIDKAVLNPESLPPGLEELRRSMNLRRASSSRPPLSSEAAEFLLTGTRLDSLGAFAAPYLDQMALRSGKSVVATLPDALFMAWGSLEGQGFGSNGPTYSGYSFSLALPPVVSVLAQMRWKDAASRIEYWPISPAEMRATRFDRRGVGRYLRGLAGGANLLETEADFAAGSPGVWNSQIASLFRASLLGLPMNWDTSSRDLLALYGSLNASERAAARDKGISLNLTTLPPFPRSLAVRLILSPDASLARPVISQERIQTSAGWVTTTSGAMDSVMPSGPMTDVTRGVNGLFPPSSRVQLRVESAKRLYGWKAQEPGLLGPRPLDFRLLANAIAFQELHPGALSYSTPDLFRFGHSREIVANFNLPGSGLVQRAFTVHDLESQGDPMTMQTLPEEIRARLRSMVAAAKEAQLKQNQPQAPPPRPPRRP